MLIIGIARVVGLTSRAHERFGNAAERTLKTIQRRSPSDCHRRPQCVLLIFFSWVEEELLRYEKSGEDDEKAGEDDVIVADDLVISGGDLVNVRDDVKKTVAFLRIVPRRSEERRSRSAERRRRSREGSRGCRDRHELSPHRPRPSAERARGARSRHVSAAVRRSSPGCV